MKKKYDYFIYYFPLFAFLFIGMGSILLSVSLSSCSSSVKNPLLLCADSLMEVSPDSALSILESISSPQKLSRADRALYALLLTQARHKNYVPLDDDSLIKTAVDYYGDRDSALCYYQKALDYALVVQDSNLIGPLYHDLAMVYYEEEDYIQADKYISKAIIALGQDRSANACLLKAKIMFNLNELDSASYYFSKDIDLFDIYGKAVCYDGMYQVAKKREEWRTAMENMDAYKTFYDSIQVLTDNEELKRLMDKHQIEEHKRILSQRTKTLVISLVSVFLSLTIICVFCFMWNDRRRKKRYIALQQELTQKRVDTMLLKEESSASNKEHKMSKLREQQLKLCISMFQSTDCYNKLETFEKSTPKQLLAMRGLRVDMRIAICEAFVDVMVNLKECCPSLTNDDLFYCILSSLHCSKTVIMELMNTTSDALKTRKNRIKNKMGTYLFEQVFNIDNL